MSVQYHDKQKRNTLGNFLTSPAGLVLLGLLMIAGFLLSTEHRGILLGLAFWLLPFACLLMHFVMHGGRGGHGGDGSHTKPDKRNPS